MDRHKKKKTPPSLCSIQQLLLSILLIILHSPITITESLSVHRHDKNANAPKQQPQRQADYQLARARRIAHGQTAATESLYRKLLETYEQEEDCTTASHLAATSSTPYHQRQVVALGAAAPSSSSSSCRRLLYQTFRRHLVKANYTNYHVGLVMGVNKSGEKRSGSSTDDTGGSQKQSPSPTPPHRLSFALSPIYITPAAAGTLSISRVEQLTQSPVECLVALFLLGATVPFETLNAVLGPEFVQLATSLSILYPSDVDPSRAIATVQIFPVELQTSQQQQQQQQQQQNRDDDKPRSLYFMTDWHPRVLSQTRVADAPADTTTTTAATTPDGDDRGSSHEPTMYIGPDSLGLVQHFWSNYHHLGQDTDAHVEAILDLCTGSGIQALYGLALYPNARATCVDISTRALHFVVTNALLNDIDPSRLDLVEGDLLTGLGRRWRVQTLPTTDGQDVRLAPDDSVPTTRALSDILRGGKTPLLFDVMMANPPFLPVPQELTSRHGKFSDGGDSGEGVLAAIVRLAPRVLKSGGILAVVSEFFLSPSATYSNDSNDKESLATASWSGDMLLERIESWWVSGMENSNNRSTGLCRGLLITNEFPIDKETYATRRADSSIEFGYWMKHLESINMIAASPGFLFLQKSSGPTKIEHSIAPRSSYGSLWTPSNPDAVAFSAKLLDRMGV